MFGIDFIRMKEIVKLDVRSILSEARGKKKNGDKGCNPITGIIEKCSFLEDTRLQKRRYYRGSCKWEACNSKEMSDFGHKIITWKLPCESGEKGKGYQ